MVNVVDLAVTILGEYKLPNMFNAMMDIMSQLVSPVKYILDRSVKYILLVPYQICGISCLVSPFK